jgi:choline transporter-like protein 2/4/5
MTIQFNEQDNLKSNLTVGIIKSGVKYIMDLLELKRSFEYAYEDFQKSLWFICSAFMIGVVISFMWILLLRFVVAPLLGLSVAIVLGLLAYGTFFCISYYLNLDISSSTDDPGFSLKVAKLFDFDYLKSLKYTWLVAGMIMGLVFLIISLVLLFLRKRIRLSIELIKESSRAIVDMPSCLFWPIFPFVLQFGVIIYCILTALYLASAGVYLYKVAFDNATRPDPFDRTFEVGDLCEPMSFNAIHANTSYSCVFYKYGFNRASGDYSTPSYRESFFEFLDDHHWVPQVYVVFMFFWLTSFISGLSEMTLAGGFAQWYWTRFKNFNFNMSNKFLVWPLIGSFSKAVSFHIGTYNLRFNN